MIRTFFKATAVAALTVASATAASAQSGTVNFVGGLQVSSTPGATTPLNIDILSGNFPPNVTGFGTPGTIYTLSATGFFSGVAASATMQDLVVTGGGTGLETNPSGQLGRFLEYGNYRFAFGPVSPATGGTINFGPISLEETAGGVDARIVVGGATVTGGACMPFCTATGLLTAQFVGREGAGNSNIYAGTGGAARLFNDINSGIVVNATSFSASFGATVVPEPSTYALLATGIGALAMVARRRRVEA
jgi:hypothetical protein